MSLNVPACSCCKPSACDRAFLFIRVKRTGKFPVSPTPTIKLWSKRLESFQYTPETFQGRNWTLGPDGLTGSGYESSTVCYPGLTPWRDTTEQVEFLAEIPGDNILDNAVNSSKYESRYYVSGALILPTKYKNIKVDNVSYGEYDINGHTYDNYIFTTGNIPNSVNSIVDALGLLRDDEIRYGVLPDETRWPLGITAGWKDLKKWQGQDGEFSSVVNTVKLQYADITKAMLVKGDYFQQEILYSLEHPVDIIPGKWFPPNTKPGCSPCKPPPGVTFCYTDPNPAQTGIPLSWFQTAPETVLIYSVGISECKDSDGHPIISVSQTEHIGIIQYNKAAFTSDSCANPTTVPTSASCANEKTKGILVLNQDVDTRTINLKDSFIPLNSNACGYELSGKGQKVELNGVCVRKPIVDCNYFDCRSIDCSEYCKPKTYIKETVTRTETIECLVGPCNSYIATYITSYDNLYLEEQADEYGFKQCGQGEQGPGDDVCSAPGGVSSSFVGYTCNRSTIQISPCSLPQTIPLRTKETVRWWSYDDNCVEETTEQIFRDETVNRKIYGSCAPYSGYTRPPGAVDCCCCGKVIDVEDQPVPGGCDAFKPSEENNVAILYAKDSTTVGPNPFLMYETSDEYFYTYTNSDGSVYKKPSFRAYMEYYLRTWKAIMDKWPDAYLYNLYYRNPLCLNSFADTARTDVYFLKTQTSKLGMTGCPNSPHYKDILPNMVVPCSSSYSPTFTGSACFSNIASYPYLKTLKDFSFKLACNGVYDLPGENYSNSPQWNRIKQTNYLKTIQHSGTCNNTKMTLDIQIPINFENAGPCSNMYSNVNLMAGAYADSGYSSDITVLPPGIVKP